jgi:hypothetical protein
MPVRETDIAVAPGVLVAPVSMMPVAAGTLVRIAAPGEWQAGCFGRQKSLIFEFFHCFAAAARVLD